METKDDGDNEAELVKLFSNCMRYTKEKADLPLIHTGATGSDGYGLEAK